MHWYRLGLGLGLGLGLANPNPKPNPKPKPNPTPTPNRDPNLVQVPLERLGEQMDPAARQRLERLQRLGVA